MGIEHFVSRGVKDMEELTKNVKELLSPKMNLTKLIVVIVVKFIFIIGKNSTIKYIRVLNHLSQC